MLPKLSHVAVMWNPDAAATRSTWEETQTSARALGMAKKIGIDPKALGLCERGKRPLSKKILKFLENFEDRHRCVIAGKFRFPVIYWQSDSKAERFCCVIRRSDMLRGLGILMSAVRFCPWPSFPSLPIETTSTMRPKRDKSNKYRGRLNTSSAEPRLKSNETHVYKLDP
jgi:hypothetical protein